MRLTCPILTPPPPPHTPLTPLPQEELGTPALAFVRAVCAVFALDQAVAEQVTLLRRQLLRLIHVREFAPEAEFRVRRESEGGRGGEGGGRPQRQTDDPALLALLFCTLALRPALASPAAPPPPFPPLLCVRTPASRWCCLTPSAHHARTAGTWTFAAIQR